MTQVAAHGSACSVGPCTAHNCPARSPLYSRMQLPHESAVHTAAALWNAAAGELTVPHGLAEVTSFTARVESILEGDEEAEDAPALAGTADSPRSTSRDGDDNQGAEKTEL